MEEPESHKKPEGFRKTTEVGQGLLEVSWESRLDSDSVLQQRKDENIGDFRERLFNTFRQHSGIDLKADVTPNSLLVFL